MNLNLLIKVIVFFADSKNKISEELSRDIIGDNVDHFRKDSSKEKCFKNYRTGVYELFNPRVALGTISKLIYIVVKK